MFSLFSENIRIALRSIRTHLLRTVLTILIIAFGLMALVGILTAIDCIKDSIHTSFTSMGANSFKIRNREENIHIGSSGKRPKRYRPISYAEAEEFIERFDFPATVSISSFASFNSTCKYKSKKTNPNIEILGGDENYLFTNGYDLDEGRNFSVQEIQSGSHVVIIGNEVRDDLFGNQSRVLNEIITIGNGKYRVIGILKSKGSSMGFGGDKLCILSNHNVQQFFPRPNRTYTINVTVKSPQQLNPATDEATGIFRLVRRVPLGEENNFEVIRSDNLAMILIENLRYVTFGTIVIGFITLLGAALGLTNIMLVSVAERTREIGTRKALGATQKNILRQFLLETIVICQIGGIIGILLGIAAGNLMALLLGSNFIIPWLWISGGIVLCFAVGIIAGIYPALQASQLPPVEALRYE
ncbi:MAG: ABC transporter permease [Bacteroidetes bacterium]|nr:ABC transporter permease [Bacteroidota bacterium]